MTVERAEGSRENAQLGTEFDYGCGADPYSSCTDVGADHTASGLTGAGFNEAGVVTGAFTLLIVPFEDEAHGMLRSEGTHRLQLHRIQDWDYFTLNPQRGHAYAVLLRGRQSGDFTHGGAYTPQVHQVTRPSAMGYRTPHALSRPVTTASGCVSQTCERKRERIAGTRAARRACARRAEPPNTTAQGGRYRVRPLAPSATPNLKRCCTRRACLR